MKQVFLVGGIPTVEDVPDPVVEPGAVLVRTAFSCISSGTELAAIQAGAESLWRRAMRQPEQVKRVMDMAMKEGISRTVQIVRGKLGSPQPVGYSASGVVLEVGEGVSDLVPGDRVAVGGAQCAFHAEILRVPRNLAVPVPDSLGLDEASTVTLGAIALQGVRRAAPTLGESFVVIGLGVLGQLTCQLLRANGCRVIAIDLDPARVDLAMAGGADMGLRSGPDDIATVLRQTDGYGADGVIITAAARSDELVSTAFQMCRRKGRVVLVGDVGLNLRRADFYAKELDFLVSCSYGPGRYDARYEDDGLDYPIGYVRWTENRNMEEFLRLLAERRVTVEGLIGPRHPLNEAAQAYTGLESVGTRPPLSLFVYPELGAQQKIVRLRPASAPRTSDRALRLAVIGAGGFARGTHLPLIKSMPERFSLHAVVSRTGHNARAVAQQFGAAYASADAEAVIQDGDVEAILIATRHDLHADLALRALEAGKHVLVEKPLALTRSELDRISAFYAAHDGPQPMLMTGFNRRFAPCVTELARRLRTRCQPMIINYRMNAGFLPADHWVHGPEGGGRNLGEACHIYDLFCFLAGADVAEVRVQAIAPHGGPYARNDNFVAIVSFADGSVATLTYTAMGAGTFPKEQMEVFCEGKVYRVEEYRGLDVWSASGQERSGSEGKGVPEELRTFADGIRSGEWPMPLADQIRATDIALRVESGLVGS